MGCGASARRHKAGSEALPVVVPLLLSTPKSQCSGVSSISSSVQPTAAAPTVAVPAESRLQDEALQDAVTKLSLHHALPGLQKLGVRCLHDIVALLVSDLEEAGLTRVQARQLQSLAKQAADANDSGAAGSTGQPEGSSAAAEASRPCTINNVGANSLGSSAVAVPSEAEAAPLSPEVRAAAPAVSPTTCNNTVEAPERETGAASQAPAWVEHLPEASRVRDPGRDRETSACATEAVDHKAMTQPVSEVSWNVSPRDELGQSQELDATLLPPGADVRQPQREALQTLEEHPAPGGDLEQTLLPDERSSALVAAGRALIGLNGRSALGGKSNEHARAEAFAAAHLTPCFSPERRPPRPPVPQTGGQKPAAAGCKLTGVNLSEPDSDLNIPEGLRRRLDQRGRDRQASRERKSQGTDMHEPDAEPTPPRSSSCDAKAVGSPTSPRRAPRAKSLNVHRSGSHGPEEEQGGRQMFDKNTLRLQHRKVFMIALERYRQKMQFSRNQTLSPAADAPDLASCTLRLNPQAIHVFLRKRPLFPKEAESGEYDVASLPPGHPLPTQLLLHNCLFEADLKRPFIQHSWFDFDHVFGEEVGNYEVYRVAASHLISGSREGGLSTLFMFGQTGSGKTHTMTAIEEYASRDLFQGADGQTGAGQDPWMSLEFVELRGNRCFDLLATGPPPEVRLRERASGSFAVEGAVWKSPRSPEELCSMMRAAHARRATAATGANSESSRSHAVCTLRLRQSGGQLMLVDCAGTERRKDSMHHSRDRQQEGAEINASLHALKECIRHFASRRNVPAHAYRASNLTKILADAFLCAGEARLAAICTASPCVSDTEHTLTTLRTGMVLGGRGPERSEKEPLVELQRELRGPRQLHPKQWSPEQVRAWLAELDRGHFADVQAALPSDFTGAMLVRVTEARCVQLCGGSQRRGQYLYAALHQEMREATEAAKTSL